MSLVYIKMSTTQVRLEWFVNLLSNQALLMGMTAVAWFDIGFKNTL